MNKEQLRGVYAPVLTPIKQDRTIDIPRLHHLCAWLMSKGVGIVLFGTTSEATSFSARERMETLDALIKAGLSPTRMMVGTGCCSIAETVELTRHAAQNGCALSLMLPSFYYRDAGNDGIIAFYSAVIETIADATIGICLYHIPQLSGVRIDYDVIHTLCERHPEHIKAIKDSSGDRSHLIGLITAFPQLLVYPGSEAFLLEGLRHGAAGCISATANIHAEKIVDIWKKYHDGENQTEQDRAQKYADKIRRHIENYPLIAALKYVLASKIDDPDWKRMQPPLMPINEKYGADLMQALNTDGFTIPYQRM